jgi:tellurite resistance protein TehA-like permease
MTQVTRAKASWLAELHPAYFALVMATGIVSIGAKLLGIRWVPQVLFSLNLLFYPTLWVLTMLRVIRHREAVLADLSHHGRAVGFFTMVAATCMFGSQWVVIAGRPQIAAWLWFGGIALYVLLVYSVFTVLTVKVDKPTLAEGIHGGWLVSVVAAQSVAVLGVQVAPSMTHPDRALFFCTATWLGGGMLYFWIIALIFYRYTFFTLAPSDLAPPYWINMGAAAVSTLAGSLLAGAGAKSPVLQQILPFVKGLTIMWWATATWWIPMLFVLGLWRHLYRKFPFRYDALYWGAVFPLGMYTAATVRLSNAIDAPFLLAIPRYFIFIAMTAWCLAFLGMVKRVVRGVVSSFIAVARSDSGSV